MKLIFIFLLQFTLFSCDLNETIALENQRNDLTDLTGVWKLDSCSSPFLSRATLIFDSQNRFYLFNHSNGGSLYLHGNRTKNNLIYGPFGESQELIVIDSKHIQTENSAGKFNFYYSKKPTEDYLVLEDGTVQTFYLEAVSSDGSCNIPLKKETEQMTWIPAQENGKTCAQKARMPIHICFN